MDKKIIIPAAIAGGTILTFLAVRSAKKGSKAAAPVASGDSEAHAQPENNDADEIKKKIMREMGAKGGRKKGENARKKKEKKAVESDE